VCFEASGKRKRKKAPFWQGGGGGGEGGGGKDGPNPDLSRSLCEEEGGKKIKKSLFFKGRGERGGGKGNGYLPADEAVQNSPRKAKSGKMRPNGSKKKKEETPPAVLYSAHSTFVGGPWEQHGGR